MVRQRFHKELNIGHLDGYSGQKWSPELEGVETHHLDDKLISEVN